MPSRIDESTENHGIRTLGIPRESEPDAAGIRLLKRHAFMVIVADEYLDVEQYWMNESDAYMLPPAAIDYRKRMLTWVVTGVGTPGRYRLKPKG